MLHNRIIHFLSINIILLQFLCMPFTSMAATDNTSKYKDNYTEDPAFIEQLRQCDQIDGNWNTSLNRCIAKKEDRENADKVKACAAIDDVKARNACFEKLAKDEADIGENSKIGMITKEEEEKAKKDADKMKWWGIIQLFIGGIVGNTNSDCYSMQISSKVGLANTLVSLATYFFMDDGTEDLRKKYEEHVSKNGADGQLEAFKFLKEEQNLSKKVAKREEMIHKFTAYGYTAASIAAIAEIFTNLGVKTCRNQYNQLKALAHFDRYGSYTQGKDGKVRKMTREEFDEASLGKGKKAEVVEVKDAHGKVIREDLAFTSTNKDGGLTTTQVDKDGLHFKTTLAGKDGHPSNVLETDYVKSGEQRLPIKTKTTDITYSKGDDNTPTSVHNSTEVSYSYSKNKDGLLDPKTQVKTTQATETLTYTQVTKKTTNMVGYTSETKVDVLRSQKGQIQHFASDGKTVTQTIDLDRKYDIDAHGNQTIAHDYRTIDNVGKTKLELKVDKQADGTYNFTQTKNGGSSVTAANVQIEMQTGEHGPIAISSNNGTTSIDIQGAEGNGSSLGITTISDEQNAKQFADLKLHKDSSAHFQMQDTSGDVTVTGENVGSKNASLAYQRVTDESGMVIEQGKLDYPIDDTKPKFVPGSPAEKLNAGYEQQLAKLKDDLVNAEKELPHNGSEVSVIGAEADAAEKKGLYKKHADLQAKVAALDKEHQRFLSESQEIVTAKSDSFKTKVTAKGDVVLTQNKTTTTLNSGDTLISGSGKETFTVADGRQKTIDFSLGGKNDNGYVTYKVRGQGVVIDQSVTIGDSVEGQVTTNIKGDNAVEYSVSLKDRDQVRSIIQDKVTTVDQVAQLENRAAEQPKQVVITKERDTKFQTVKPTRSAKMIKVKGKVTQVKGVPSLLQAKSEIKGKLNDAAPMATLTGKTAKQYEIMEYNRVHSKLPPEIVAKTQVVQVQRPDGSTALVYRMKTQGGESFFFDRMEAGERDVNLGVGDKFIAPESRSYFADDNQFRTTKLDPVELDHRLNNVYKMQEETIPAYKPPPIKYGAVDSIKVDSYSPNNTPIMTGPKVTTPDILGELPSKQDSPAYWDDMWRNVKNEQERYYESRKWDDKDDAKDSIQTEGIIHTSFLPIQTIPEFSDDYIERLDAQMKDIESDTDAMFAFRELHSYFMESAVHSPSLVEYHQAIKDGRFANLSMPEENFKFKDFLVDMAKMTNQSYKWLLPTAHAKESFGDKAGNIIYGGKDQKFDFDTIMTGGGMIGGALRGMAVSYLFKTIGAPVAQALKPILAHPAGIATINGINAKFQFDLAKHSKKQVELCDKRIALLDDAMKKMGKLNLRYCLAGRDNLSEPECYCYNEDGTKNESHRNSQTCVAYWASKNQFDKFQAANTYGGADPVKNACITYNGQYDPNCKCKKYKDKKTGQNACMKAASSPTNMISLGNAAGVPTINKGVNGIFEGDTTAMANVVNSQGARLAARQAKIRKKLLDQVNKKLISKGRKPLPSDKMAEKIMHNILKKVPMSQSAVRKLSSLMSPKVGLSGKGLSALKKAARKTGVKSIYSRPARKQKGGKEDKQFDFGLGDNGTGRQRINTAGFMNKKYKYKKNDIVKNSGVSIFRIISNRYQQSGLERLFPDE